jgi:hypothetical protein
MLNPIEKKRYQERFATIESSFRVEGMDPIEDAVYREAKARLLRGEMTPKQALTYVFEETGKRHQHASVSR